MLHLMDMLGQQTSLLFSGQVSSIFGKVQTLLTSGHLEVSSLDI